jgi:hypothetical protein
MKSIAQVILLAVFQYVSALLIGAVGLFLLMTVMGLSKGPTAPINFTATAGMLMMFILVGGLFFCIPGGFAALVTALVVKTQRIQASWILALCSALVAFVIFYVLLTLHGNAHLARIQSVDGPIFFPRESLSQLAVWTAPIAFALCTVGTDRLYKRILLRSQKLAK